MTWDDLGESKETIRAASKPQAALPVHGAGTGCCCGVEGGHLFPGAEVGNPPLVFPLKTSSYRGFIEDFPPSIIIYIGFSIAMYNYQGVVG